MSHLDEGTIHAWLDDALPPDEAARVDAHVKDCADCAALVAEARGFIAGASRIVSSLDVVRGDVIPAATVTGAAKPTAPSSLWKSLKFTPARAAIAATLLVGLASMLTLRRQGEMTARSLADTTVAAVAEAPAAAVAPMSPPPSATANSAPGAGAAVGTVAGATRAARPASPKREPTAQSANELESMKAGALPPAAAAASAQSAVAAAPPPPAPVPAAVTADARRFREPPALTEVVVTGLSERRDSAANRARSARAAAGAPVRDAVGQKASGVVAGSTPQAPIEESVVGCYRLRLDPSVDLHGFPESFRLTRDSVPAGNAVRIVRDGRESVLSGASWRMMITSVLVTAADAPAGRQMLLFAPEDLGATLTRVGGRFTGKVERIECSR